MDSPEPDYSSGRLANLTVSTVFMQVSRLTTTPQSSLCPESWGQGHPNPTLTVRQGSFTDRSPTRGSAVNVGVLELVVAQHLQMRAIALQIPSPSGKVACPLRAQAQQIRVRLVRLRRWTGWHQLNC